MKKIQKIIEELGKISDQLTKLFLKLGTLIAVIKMVIDSI